LIEAIIFDFDGTLVDSDPIKRSAFFDVTNDIVGASEALEMIFAQPFPGDRYVIFKTLAARMDLELADDWTEAYGRQCQVQFLDLIAQSDVGQTLEALKTDGYQLFIASATPQINLVLLIESSPLAEYFSGIYGRPTSKADIMCSILKRHGWTEENIVMVGNGEDDRQAAEAVGCAFVGVVGYGDSFKSHPQISLQNLDGLPNILRHHNDSTSQAFIP
jgi:phosphoglycolate phosphatase